MSSVGIARKKLLDDFYKWIKARQSKAIFGGQLVDVMEKLSFEANNLLFYHDNLLHRIRQNIEQFHHNEHSVAHTAPDTDSPSY